MPDRAPLTVPTVDVGPAVEGRQLDEVAERLGSAARSVGFVQLVGHGIDPDLFEAVHVGADRLWAMDDDALRAMRSPTGHPFRGVDLGVDEHGDRIWQRLQNVRIDTAEEAAALGVDPAHLDFFGGNVHPPVPGLREAVDACFAEGRRVGLLLVSLFAIDLGLAPDALSRWFEDDVSYFAVQDYPPMGHPAPGGLRIPEHSDSGAVTLLHQRGGYEGLQVRAVDGRRTTVPVVEGALVVNTGDLMARWTNDRYPATPHAVIDGPVGEGRATIAMHLLPGVDTVIEPLPGLTADDGPRYAPVSMYDWDRRYFEKRSLVLSLADEA